jgi:KaiC/GvpD/RAD55 family RecA-like ATPase
MAKVDPVLGLAELDRELAPVLPSGWLALLEGRPGSGLPLFAKQFAQAGIGITPVLYYTTYERTEDVLKVFAEFGWKTEGLSVVNLAEEYYERVLRRDLEVSKVREQGLTLKDLTGVPPSPLQRRTFNLENRLLADLSAIEKPFRLVLDSLDFFLEVLAPAQVTAVARQIRHLAQQYRGQALLTLQADVHERRTQGLLEDLADLIVELKAEPGVDSYDHVFDIRKVRNHPDKTRIGTARATPRGLELGDSPAGPRSP